MKNLKKSILGVFVVAAMSGCATTQQEKMLDTTPVEAIEAIEQMDKIVESVDMGNSERDFLEYKLIPERDDFLSVQKNLRKKVPDLKIRDAPLHDVLSQLASDLKVGIVYQIESPMTLKRNLTIDTNNTRFDDYIRIVENTGNVDIYFVGNNMVVADTVAISGNFSKLEGANGKVYKELESYLNKVLKRQVQSIYEPVSKSIDVGDLLEEASGIEVGSDEVSGESGGAKALVKKKQKEEFFSKINQIRTDIDGGNKVQVEFEPVVVIDELTGAFFIKTEPNLLRRSKELIENVINSSLSYALVQLDIYQVNDQRAKSFGISAEKIVDNLYKLSVGGAGATIPEGKLPSFDLTGTQVTGSDSFNMGIKAYEETGIIRGESNTVVTLFNGITTELDDTKEVGYWVPGDLKENTNTVDGAVVTTFTEDRPTFELSKVGKTLKVLPRIDQSNKVLNMEIEYSDSQVYDYSVFEWQRNTQNGETVELANPLKSENKIKGVIFAKSGQSSILVGTKGRDASMTRGSLPGTSGTPLKAVGSFDESSQKSNNFIIVSPIFPNKKSIQLVKKVGTLQ